ncbi:hypothetical protein GCM10010468_04250 [Actinocorallia longicatena]|uniref:Major facilitator superfamily (MFS) profile domain-containing protein n=1 Tax=Actinocorallia longicatena TaxID=111803 RepID=A0ABP6PXA3_9ACTN
MVPGPIVHGIQQSLGANGADLAWVTAAFLLPAASLALNAGLLSDLFGRKRMLMIGVSVVAAGETLTGLASSIHQLQLGQAVTGVGAGVVIPASLAIATAGAPTALSRSRGVATWTMTLSLATMVGFLYSSLLSKTFAWQASFLGVAPLALVGLVVIALFADDSEIVPGRSLDWAGQVTLAIGIGGTLFAVASAALGSWTSVTTLLAAFVALTSLAAFPLAERREATPMLNLDIFKVPTFSAAVVAAVIGSFAFMGSVYVLSVRLGLQGKSATDSAIYFVVLQGVPSLLGLMLPRMMDHFRARPLIATGLILLTTGEVWFAFVPITRTGLLVLLGPLLLIGAGFLFIFSALTAAAMNAISARHLNLTTAVISAARNIGLFVGPIAITALLQRSAPPSNLDDLWHGYSVGLLICAAASLLATYTTLIWLREARTPTDEAWYSSFPRQTS